MVSSCECRGKQFLDDSFMSWSCCGAVDTIGDCFEFIKLDSCVYNFVKKFSRFKKNG